MDVTPAISAPRPQQGVLRGTSTIPVGPPSLLRAINERTVLDLIHRQGPLSLAQVGRVSGLSKPTVSLALTGLLEADLVREVGRSRGERGPSALLYELNPMAGWVVGVDIGRKWVRAAIADIAGTIVARRDERARVTSAGTLIGQVGATARRLAAEAGVDWSHVTHATLGSPGVFEPLHGYVAMAPNLPGWRGSRGCAPPPLGPPHADFVRRGRATPAGVRAVRGGPSLLGPGIATVPQAVGPGFVIRGGALGGTGALVVEPIEQELRQFLPFR